MVKKIRQNIKFLFSKLFVHIYCYFAIILTLVSFLIGVIFMNLYSKSTTDSYRKQLEEQALAISERMVRFIREKNYKEYPSYITLLSEVVVSSDIYIVSNPNAKNAMPSNLENVKLEAIKIFDQVDTYLSSAFSGKMDYIIAYNKEIYDDFMIAVTVPIWGVGEVVGAVLIYSPVESQKKVLASSTTLIFISILVSLLISGIIAAIFANNLSRPISNMRITALKLAEGNYDIKTGIKRTDELGSLANSIDVLSEKLCENEIEHKNMEQMRIDFFANVSHELRTPITVVRAYIEMLLDGIVTDEQKTKHYYERILSECKGMERLVGDLLLLSKMQNPDFVIDMEPINLVEIFEEVWRSAKAISVEKKIQIEISLEKELYLILGDYDRLRQMFMIIVDNAIKFSREGCSIFIIIESKDKDIVSISIRDEGVGISTEELPHIFDKFYKSKLKQNAKGSGLGLAIAKQIVVKHGGTIEVKSELGIGTEFIFSFNLLNNEDF